MQYTVEMNWCICTVCVGQTVGDGLVYLYCMCRADCRGWIGVSVLYV